MSVLINGATEIVSIADNDKFNWTPVDQVRSFSCYWKSSSLPNVNNEYQVLFQLDNVGSGNCAQVILVMFSGLLILVFAVTDSAWATIGAFYCVPSFSVNTWYHLAFVASSAGNNKIYINGVSQSVTDNSWDDNTPITPVAIRVSNTYAVSDDFDLAHLAWFSDELTQTEVNNLRADPYCMDSNANILLSMHFDEMTGTTAHDVQTVTTKTDGTLTGGATWSGMPSGITHNLSSSLSAAGALSGSPIRRMFPSLTLSAAGAMSDTGPRIMGNALALTGSAALTDRGALTTSPTLTLSGLAALTDSAQRTHNPTITLAGLSALAALIGRTTSPTLILTADGQLVASYGGAYSEAIALGTVASLTDTILRFTYPSLTLGAQAVLASDSILLTPFPSTGIIDNFNRADANSLGSNWSRGYGDLLGVFGIQSNQADVYSQVSGYTQGYWNQATYGPQAESFITVTDWGDGLGRINLTIKMINPDSTNTSSGYTLTVYGANWPSTPSQFHLKYVAEGVSYLIGDPVSPAVSVADGDKYGVRYADGVLSGWHCPVSTGQWYCVVAIADDRYEDQVGVNLMYHHAGSGLYDILLDDFGGGNYSLGATYDEAVIYSASGAMAGSTLVTLNPSLSFSALSTLVALSRYISVPVVTFSASSALSAITGTTYLGEITLETAASFVSSLGPGTINVSAALSAVAAVSGSNTGILVASTTLASAAALVGEGVIAAVLGEHDGVYLIVKLADNLVFMKKLD